MSYAQGGAAHQQQQQPQRQQQAPPQQPPQAPSIASFGSLSGQSQQQQPFKQESQQQDSPAHHHHPTLPPLQSQNGGFAQFGNLSYAHPGSQSHTPTTPHTPTTNSIQGHNSNGFPTHMHSPAAGASGSMLPPSSYNPYTMSSSMYPSSTATSMPSSTSSVGLPTIRPMPPGGVGAGLGGLPSLTGQIGQLGQQSFMQSEEAPTHVVGSQGRRGILPSAPGRPNPPAQGTAQSTKSMIPQKDADGKFPCPHCNKTYLHAKHLKRHLLRHTGDRPYMCHLCKDTFSRSDILKRHFQKCSIRRGNPTGANHLAHQRRNTNGSNRLSISQQDGPIGLAALPDVNGQPYNVSSSPTVNGDASGRTSRANSIVNPGAMSHRNSLNALGIMGSGGSNGESMNSSAPYNPAMYAMHQQHQQQQQQQQQQQNGGQPPSNYAFNAPQMGNNMYNNAQQMSFLGQQSSRFSNSHNNSPIAQSHGANGDNGAQSTDWSRMFNQTGQDGFIGGSQPVNASSQGINTYIKTEQDMEGKNNFDINPSSINQESFLGSLYSHPSAFGSEEHDNEHGIPGFPNWSMDDPLQAKVDRLMEFCFPHGANTVDHAAAEAVQMCLSVENVKHFAEHYTSFQGHWPIIHMPTFKLTDANDGLVMAMICVGAIYSPKFNVDQVRQMMEFVAQTVKNKSNTYQRALSGQTEGLGNSSWDIEEFQALVMIQCMFMWNGDTHQREAARNEFPTLCHIAKSMRLMQTAEPGHYAYSSLHHTHGSSDPAFDRFNFCWRGWLEQEKRSRAMYLLFLLDAAMAIYFNCRPQFDPLEIRLPLPSDDAAWDARDHRECVNALGLNGHEAQQRNLTGTRKSRQPGMREAMRTLLEPNATFQPGATNAYSKFVLIHALNTKIINVQRQLNSPDGAFPGFSFGLGSSAPATPLSQNDWLEQHNGGASGSNSGHGTPTADGFGPAIANVQAQQEKKRLDKALNKWKRTWDQDTEIQYPPSHLAKRFGFSRDGVHFFFLGRSFLQSSRPQDWTATADQRFTQTMALLKKIKQFVMHDNSRGLDLGSVGDIDETYGTDNLTLNMKLLFKPYNSTVDGMIAGVRT
ncbi:hypothetical protein MBLNU230_g4246t2 [Neophaeotheca triangularis]